MSDTERSWLSLKVALLEIFEKNSRYGVGRSQIQST